MGNARAGTFKADILHRLVKAVTVLCLVDGIDTRANQFNVVLFQDAVRGQLKRRVQSRLATHGRQNRVGALFVDDLFKRLPIDRLDIGGVRHGRIGHDGRGVRVHQNNSVALFAKRFTRLRTRVVKLTCLANDDGACTNNQDAIQVRSSWHQLASMSAMN